MSAASARRHFAAAPWPRTLKLTSAFGTVLLAAVGAGAYRVVPIVPGFTHAFGLGVALVPLVLLVTTALFMVTGYTVQGRELLVDRLVWASRIPLDGLSRLSFVPTACKGSLRIFGNAGLFSFTGMYRSRALGRYRLFGTDLAQSVVLVLPGRVDVRAPTLHGVLARRPRGRYAGTGGCPWPSRFLSAPGSPRSSPARR